MSDAVEQFTINFPDTALADLKARLRVSRLPDPIPGSGWTRGMDYDCLRDLLDYWATDFCWRDAEAALNAFDHYRTTIDGLPIHFVHARSPHASAMPLMMVHGWPGSIIEFVDMADRLTQPEKFGGDPAQACHLVMPSLPGFGLSGKPREPGWHIARTARAFAELMGRLGYARYGVQGGDFGAMVVAEMGIQDEGRLIGLHTNMPIVGAPDDPPALSAEEAVDVADMKAFYEKERAYAMLQATKPDTIGVSLTDSPAGLCAWIAEKFHSWTDRGENEAIPIDRDRLLANISLYWLTATGASAARFYYEYFNDTMVWKKGRIAVPSAIARFPKEMNRPPRSWVEPCYNIVRWNRFDRGGHFAAMEVPELLAPDILAFFAELNNR